MVAGENAMLKKICDKTDGAENASVFVFFDNLLTQMGYTVKDKNGITITGDRPIVGSFDKGSVKLTTHATNGYIDKEFLVPAFTPVTFYYQKEKMTVPAFTFTDKDAFKDFVFESRYLETLDWSMLSEKQKDDYYFEFVMHYLPEAFSSSWEARYRSSSGRSSGSSLAERSRNSRRCLPSRTAR